MKFHGCGVHMKIIPPNLFLPKFRDQKHFVEADINILRFAFYPLKHRPIFSQQILRLADSCRGSPPRALTDPKATPRAQQVQKNELFQAHEAMAKPRYQEDLKAMPRKQ